MLISSDSTLKLVNIRTPILLLDQQCTEEAKYALLQSGNIKYF